jgi:hypothetical protein
MQRKAMLFTGGLLPRTVSEAKAVGNTCCVQVSVKIKLIGGGEKTITFSIHKNLVNNVKAIMKDLYDADFRFDKNNNISAYYPRLVAGTSRLSNHSFGCAIDINSAVNPHYHKKGLVNDSQNDNSRGIIRGYRSDAVRIFARHGWGWLGKIGDMMHFSFFGGH